MMVFCILTVLTQGPLFQTNILSPTSGSLPPCRTMWYCLLKRWYQPKRPHSVTPTRPTTSSPLTTSNLIYKLLNSPNNFEL